MKLLRIPLLTLALLASSLSMAQSSPAKVADGMLVGPNGMTLYVFDRDMGPPATVPAQPTGPHS